MTDRIFVSEALDSDLRRVGEAFDDVDREIGGTDMPTRGIDPSTVAATKKSSDATKKHVTRAKTAADKGREHAREQEEESEKSRDRIDGTDTDGTRLKDGDGKKGDPSGANKTETSSGTSPSGEQPQSAPQSTSPMSSMPTSQVGSPSYNPSSPPTAANANQFDMNNAPNRDALRTAIKEAVQTGNWGSGDKGDDRPTQGGGGKVDPAAGGTEFEKKLLEAVDKAVNSEPPIPYAWGGGHGGSPGTSQGTTDGGFADQMGDYNKVGVDCSGFSRWMLAEATGQDIANGTSEAQYNMGSAVTDPRPGDLVFPGSAGRPPMHVQVYIGNGQVAEAQQSGTFLKVTNLQEGSEFRRFVTSE